MLTGEQQPCLPMPNATVDSDAAVSQHALAPTLPCCATTSLLIDSAMTTCEAGCALDVLSSRVPVGGRQSTTCSAAKRPTARHAADGHPARPTWCRSMQKTSRLQLVTQLTATQLGRHGVVACMRRWAPAAPSELVLARRIVQKAGKVAVVRVREAPWVGRRCLG